MSHEQTISKPRFVILAGVNGSGKSTLYDMYLKNEEDKNQFIDNTIEL